MCLMELSDLPQLKPTFLNCNSTRNQENHYVNVLPTSTSKLLFICVCVVYDRYDHEFAQSEVFDYEHGHSEKQSTLQRSSGHTDSRSTHKVIHVTYNLNVLFYFLWAVL